MKNTVLVALCSVVVIALLEPCSANTNSSHNLQIGNRQVVYTDKLFLKQTIKINSQWLSRISEKRTFTTDGKARITMIKAIDQKQNGNGAHVSLVSGGIGKTYVTLEFNSQQSHGVDFVVEIYAAY